MHGKAQREPARYSVVLNCKLLPLRNAPKFVCCLLYNIHAARLAVCPSDSNIR